MDLLTISVFVVLATAAIYSRIQWANADRDRKDWIRLYKTEHEQHVITCQRLHSARCDGIDGSIQIVELDRDLRRIKIAIWGTAEIDRNASDIEKLIADWRTEINQSASRIAELEPALRDANAICQTAHAVANRMGRETKWGRFAAQIEESLEHQERALEGTAPSVPTSLNTQPSTLN